MIHLLIKPVIATNVGGIPKLIMNGKTGFLVHAGNPHSLEEKMRYVMENPIKIREMGKQAKRYYNRHYSLSVDFIGTENNISYPILYLRKFSLLRIKKFTILLLGGPDEDEKNRRLSQHTHAFYYGVFFYRQFMGLMNFCDLVVTSVTMALHIAIGIKKKIRELV